MANTRDEQSTPELLKEAVEDSRELLRTEAELAKNEIQKQAKTTMGAAGAFTIAAFASLFAFAALLAALLIAVGASPAWGLFIAGCTMLLVAAAGAGIGFGVVPKQPLGRTKARLETDVRALRRHGA
jgi:uncharacterized membrane protein YqjE